MSYTIKIEPAFKRDYKRLVARHPQLREELLVSLREFEARGSVPREYNPHALTDPQLSYFGLMEYHLAAGRYDVLVIYQPHHTNPVIRMVRMGSHDELFHG